MTRPLNSAEVSGATEALGLMLRDLPPYDYRDRAPYDAAVQRVATTLETFYRARCKHDGNGASLSMLGLRATSTTGFFGACQNWRAQAVAKLAAQAMAGQG